jgi:hypothetical protein
VSAQSHTITPCPGCNENLEVPLDRGDVGLLCPGCGHRWDWYAPPRPKKKQRKRLAIVLLVLAVSLLGVALFWMSVDNYIEAGHHLTPYSVSVRGYYRRDGTYVHPYNRRPPGGVMHDVPYEQTRFFCGLGMFSGAGLCLMPPFLVALSRKTKKPAGQVTGQQQRKSSPPVRGGCRTDAIARIEENPPAPPLLPMRLQSVVKISPPARAPTPAKTPAMSCPGTLQHHDKDSKASMPPVAQKADAWVPTVKCTGCGCLLDLAATNSSGTASDEVIFERAIGAAYCRRCSETVKFCNCAGCSAMLQGDQIAGRVRSRPYCEKCLEPHPLPAGRAPRQEDMGPWQENAVRQLEGD